MFVIMRKPPERRDHAINGQKWANAHAVNDAHTHMMLIQEGMGEGQPLLVEVCRIEVLRLEAHLHRQEVLPLRDHCHRHPRKFASSSCRGLANMVTNVNSVTRHHAVSLKMVERVDTDKSANSRMLVKPPL